MTGINTEKDRKGTEKHVITSYLPRRENVAEGGKNTGQQVGWVGWKGNLCGAIACISDNYSVFFRHYRFIFRSFWCLYLPS